MATNVLSNYSLSAVGRVQRFQKTSNGGILFSTVEDPDTVFVLIDDDMKCKLFERIIPGIDVCSSPKVDLQPIVEAEKVLEDVIGNKAYVAIFAAELFGIPIYQLQYSEVPGYALRAYRDPQTSAAEREEILLFTRFADDNPDFYKEAFGNYIAIEDARVVRKIFNSPAEIKPSKPGNRIICLCVGVMGG
ncbi:MAG: hypothetical protein EOP56_19590, partial [Sphingobacteriales bacterium]